ncbi:lysophospholipase [Aestuariibacter sp. AA17]|uniref:Lysophospholipase n=1 Tax=Fluctibacter corallii TaxID=2984329 RepID=A0ABT3AD75_9ALTE|nr:lysophospholipase [Aestuariibacter sp. AA17]MCV2886252.1 lysophospholipase [Aestuariibacter sp. AA17]
MTSSKRFRLYKFLFFINMMYTFSSFAGSESNVSGNWYGLLSYQGQDFPLIFRIDAADGRAFIDSPSQNAYNIPAEVVKNENSSITLVSSILDVNFKGEIIVHAGGPFIFGLWKQGDIELKLKLYKRVEGSGSPSYRTEHLSFKGIEGKLSGTLSFPKGNDLQTLLILCHGSGPHTREQIVAGHKTFEVLTNHLNSLGFSVFSYDKRGTGSSKGDFMFTSLKDQLDDLYTIIDNLSNRPEFSNYSIGLMGHSEGSLRAAEASSSQHVKFIVMLAPPIADGVDLIRDQNRIAIGKMALSKKAKTLILSTMDVIYEEVIANSDVITTKLKVNEHIDEIWEDLGSEDKKLLMEWKLNLVRQLTDNSLLGASDRDFIKAKPMNIISRIRKPTLVLFGGKDVQVEASKNSKLLNMSKVNVHIESHIMPNMNHIFQETTNGAVELYYRPIEPMSKTMVSYIENWVIKNQLFKN